MSPAQMVAELEHRFDFLVSRKRDVERRHRTLRAALEWSYRLLSPELQRFFAQLSVFRGGWLAEAAEAVWQEPKALDYLEELRECSLVLAEEGADQAEGMRFRMLETLREYAAEQLSPEEQSALAKRHAEYCLALAEEAEPELEGPKQAEWLDRLDAEHDNLRAALAWFKSAEDGAEAGLRLAGALGIGLWAARGYWIEGRAYLTEMLARERADRLTAERGKALRSAGWLAVELGDYGEARSCYGESLTISRELGDKEGIASALKGLGVLARERGDCATARALYEEGLATLLQLGDRSRMAGPLMALGLLVRGEGDLAAARSLLEESLTIFRQTGDERGAAKCVHNLAYTVKAQGEGAAARSLYEESLAAARELGDKWVVKADLHRLAELAEERGDHARAGELYEESLALARELGNKKEVAGVLDGLAWVAEGKGDYAAAQALREESQAILGELRGDIPQRRA